MATVFEFPQNPETSSEYNPFTRLSTALIQNFDYADLNNPAPQPIRLNGLTLTNYGKINGPEDDGPINAYQYDTRIIFGQDLREATLDCIFQNTPNFPSVYWGDLALHLQTVPSLKTRIIFEDSALDPILDIQRIGDTHYRGTVRKEDGSANLSQRVMTDYAMRTSLLTGQILAATKDLR
jgi:hypothetical protein